MTKNASHETIESLLDGISAQLPDISINTSNIYRKLADLLDVLDDIHADLCTGDCRER